MFEGKRPTKPAGEAALKMAEARAKIIASKEDDSMEAYFDRGLAQSHIESAESTLTLKEPPVRIAGNEIVVKKDNDWLIDTTKNPDLINAEAVEARIVLLSENDCVEMGLDAVQSVGAKNSLEKMLVQQMAVAHRQAMKTLSHADEMPLDASSVDIKVKLINVSARMMAIFQNGLQTIAKVRNGGKQQVIVQHVHVAGEGKAVVAGKMDYPPRGPGRGGSHEK